MALFIMIMLHYVKKNLVFGLNKPFGEIVYTGYFTVYNCSKSIKIPNSFNC